MKATAELRREHARILKKASLLNGLAGSRMTADVAQQSRAVILGIDQLLVDHLTKEDEGLYPTLMLAADPVVREAAQTCFEDMGGILGAWIAYRQHWTVPAIAADPQRFQAASGGVIGALAMRVERENQELYPMMDALSQTADRGACAA